MSLRARIILLVLLLGVVPLGLIGLWGIFVAARSGETVLRTRLEAALDETTAELNARWALQRSEALDLAEGPARRMLSEDAATGLLAAEGSGGAGARDMVLLDAEGRVRWRGGAEAAAGGIPLEVAVHASTLGSRTGTLRLTIPAATLFGELRRRPSTVGSVIGVFDDRDQALLPAPFDPRLLTRPRFRWGGDEWLTARRQLLDPPLTLVAGAPLTPYTEPVRAAVLRSTWVLLLVAACGLGLAMLLTARMTRSLESLVTAAEAVAAGDLERSVPERGRDEVSRLARAFNHMTGSLRDTLLRLTEQRSLALVGEFAADLAHEVRNPLTGIRVNLQLVEEQLPADSPALELQRAALEDIQRLDSTVTSALHAARSGRVRASSMSLDGPVARAHRAAAVQARERGVLLAPPPATLAGLRLRGDAAALEQLFLNLLLNAIQAARPGDRVALEAWQHPEGGAHVVVRDTGPGMDDEVLRRAFDPLFSTRPDGTGLGLAIARRIAAAHGGSLELESSVGGGTAAHVRLPAPPRHASEG